MNSYPEYSSITAEIVDAAIEVHRHLGPGLLENAYKRCLAYELTTRGLKVEMELSLPIKYKELRIDHGYRIDILVEDAIVIETKTVEKFSSVHTAQVLTYLTLGEYPIGFLLNFHVTKMKYGIKRLVL